MAVANNWIAQRYSALADRLASARDSREWQLEKTTPSPVAPPVRWVHWPRKCSRVEPVLAWLESVGTECRVCRGADSQLAHAQVSPTTAADVVRVVDGDTVDVRFDDGKLQRLRLIGMDTPEVVDPAHISRYLTSGPR